MCVYERKMIETDKSIPETHNYMAEHTFT
jgi:hypothetical protein